MWDSIASFVNSLETWTSLILNLAVIGFAVRTFTKSDPLSKRNVAQTFHEGVLVVTVLLFTGCAVGGLYASTLVGGLMLGSVQALWQGQHWGEVWQTNTRGAMSLFLGPMLWGATAFLISRTIRMWGWLIEDWGKPFP